MHTQEKAVSSLLYKFQQRGFILQSVNDGEENFLLSHLSSPTNDIKLNSRKEAVDIICSVDQSCVRVKKDSNLATLLIVLGNDDSEILYDYSASSEEFMQEVELIAEEFYQQWEKE